MHRLVVCGAAVAALTLLLSLLPASAQVVLPGTQPGDLVNWPLQPATECQTCHGGYVAGLDYEPFDSWAGSMMANAARDPLFWAAVDIANQDAPGSGELCIRCHAPAAWLAGRSGAADGSDLLGYPDEPGNDFEGIDCHFCHRMYEGPEGSPFTQNGQYWVDDGTPTTEPPRRGPYAATFAPHEWAYSSYHASSEICGTCHDLRNPLVNLKDEAGVDTGLLFPEQLTYTEWTQSAFAVEGTSCQDCHMPPAETTPAYACNSFNPPRPDTAGGDDTPVYRHDLVGANTFIPRVLKGEYGAALGREEAYDTTLALALRMLQEQSATVELAAPSVAVEGDSLVLDVRVTNLSGHKLPTGYPEGRRMWLSVEATDALGTPFFASGAYEDSSATLVVDPQLRVYETVHGVHGEGAGFHLVRNDRILLDTRIPPRGFQPTLETAPVGADYPPQPDGSLAHWDDVSYRIEVPEGVQGPVSVRATLRYQTASREYVEFLRDENVSGPDPHDRNYPNAPSRGEKIHSLWQSYGKSAPVDMVTTSALLPVVAPPDNVSDLLAEAGHDRVRLSWTPPPSASGVRLMRKLWGAYPEFGSAPALRLPPSPPARYEDALAEGWVEVYDGLATAHVDSGFTGATRDVAFYAAYAYDGNGVHARQTSGSATASTSYRLGDVGEVGVPGVYDGMVDGVADLPVFSLAYGTVPTDPGWNPECDLAPTDDGSSLGIPLPDDRVDFQDLVVFALQFGSPVPFRETPAEAGPVRFVVGPAIEVADGWRLPLRVGGDARQVKALRLELAGGFDEGRVAVEVGAALADRPSFLFAQARPGGLVLDLAVLGAGVGMAAEGVVASLRLSRDCGLPTVTGLDVRDRSGASLEAAASVEGARLPSRHGSRLALSSNVPNPFNPRTRLELSLPSAGPVEVVVYDIAGRRVKTLLRATRPEGVIELVWDGTDEQGRAVASGIYLCHARAAGQSTTRRMALVR